jgi:hypothetical protein
MTWEPDRRGLAFTPSETSSAVFILESGQDYQGEKCFYIKMEIPTGDRKNNTIYVSVEFRRLKQNVLNPVLPGKRFCLIINGIWSNVRGRGTMFLLEDETSTELHLSFLSSIAYWLDLKPNPASSEELISAYAAYTAARGIKCVVDCGESIYFL